MSLRLPAAEAVTDHESGASPENAPLSNPFAAGPGGFVISDDMDAKKGRYTSIMILVGVLLIAGGLLFFMRQIGMGPKLDFETITIDYPLEVIDQGISSRDHTLLLDDLRSGGKVNRVPLDQVQTNPFEWRSLKPVEKPTERAVDPAELSRRELEEHKQRLASAAASLKINSIMGGRVPMARISGDLVRVGDVLGETFKVTRITGRTVELEAEGMTFTLTLGEP